jgi:hypothetical protein
MLAAVAQLQHLHEELDVDDTAAAGLDVEAAGVLARKLVLDAASKVRDLGLVLGQQRCRPDAGRQRGVDARGQLGIRVDDACADQRLALPQIRLPGVLLDEALERGDERPAAS